LDLSGGTLDVWPIHLSLPEPAVTVNVAFDLPARAVVTPLPDGRIELISKDRGTQARFENPAALARALQEGTASLGLLARAVAALCPDGGVRLETHARSPVGAGLGGSSALLVAVLGALGTAQGASLDKPRLRQLAQDIETATLGHPTGYQDYCPPLWGGLLALEGRPGGLLVESMDCDLAALAARLRVIYTGAPHASGITNWGVVRAFFDGDPSTVSSLRALAEISRSQRAAFRAGDLEEALALMVEDGRLRRAMAKGVSTPQIERLDAGARAAGALGTKICGAGGGGCVVVVLGPDAGARVDARLTELAHVEDVRLVPVVLPAEGLHVAALE
jgi:D-glycero-alpha-D-manno-heptose-7-phosphate kinase